MLLSGEPSIIGREPAGSSATIATHQPAETISAARPASEAGDPPAQARRRADQVREPEPGNDEQRLAHLRQEGEADQRAGRDEPARARVLERPHHAVGGGDEQHHEQRVGVVEAEHQRRDRRDRQHRAGGEPGRRAEPAPHRREQQRRRRRRPRAPAARSMLQLEKPKTRPESAITQSEAGGLSTVMKHEESSEPKKNAFQLCVAACTAAA